MLSIGHLTASLSEKGSGVKAVVERLSFQAHVVGHRVRVFGFDEPGAETWRGGPAVRLPLSGPAALGHAPGMNSALADFEPDVVHAHGLWLLFAKAALNHKRRTGTPYVISAHGMLSSVALQIKPWRKRIARVLYQARILEQADCIVVTSENELEHIRDVGLRGSVAVIPLGIEDAQPVSKFLDDGEKTVLYLGRKLQLKGLNELALAWKDLAPRFSDWRLQIIGPDSGGYEAELQALIKKNEVPRIELLPPVSGPARDAAYCSSQISILPSKSENFALTVGESLVRGIPVIASRATPWSGLEANHCGLWVDGDKESIRAALEQMMNLSAVERFSMGGRGRDWILRDFQWATLAEKHHQLYRWLLGQEDRPDFVHAV